MPDEMTALSAFSGVGGFDLGLEAAGFRHVGCIEFDEAARRSLKANRANQWPLLDPGDITLLSKTIEPRTVGLTKSQLGILAGGPPCQPFSKAAQWSTAAKVGLRDARAACLNDFLSLVEKFLPRVLLMENVTGFVNGETSAITYMRRKLQDINQTAKTRYELQQLVVDAADYGVPQHRKRVLLLACRDGESFSWPRSTHSEHPMTAWDAIGDLALEPFELPILMGKWAELLPSIPEGRNYLWHTDRGGGEPIFGYRTRFWSFLLKLKKNLPSWTLPAQPGPATGPFHWENRPLATKELLRLQSFPVTWIVEGDYRTQVRQIGNATPPLLAETIGRAIGSQLFEKADYPAERTYSLVASDSIPPAHPRQPIRPQFLDLCGTHQAHPGAGKGPRPRITVVSELTTDE